MKVNGIPGRGEAWKYHHTLSCASPSAEDDPTVRPERHKVVDRGASLRRKLGRGKTGLHAFRGCLGRMNTRTLMESMAVCGLWAVNVISGSPL